MWPRAFSAANSVVLLGALLFAGAVLTAVTAAPAAVLPTPVWRHCPDTQGLECAELVVPVDHADSDGATIDLPARRLPAADPTKRIGVLVTIAGGPGQRGTDLVDSRRYSLAVREAFDIVGWDPRGTSGETLIDCIPEWDPFGDLDRTPDTPVERAMLDRTISELADRCLARHARLLPFLGTRETVLDLDALRTMLGEDVISLHGTSYGSKVAVLYATHFPDRVRAAVLDGYADPNQSPVARDLEQATAFERELDRVIAACGDALLCALGDDGDPGAALDALLDHLDTAPLPVDDERVLTEGDVYEAIAAALVRDRRARERLINALGEAAAGDGSALLDIADSARDAFTESGLTLGAFAAISCADDAAFWRSLGPDAVERHVEAVHAAAPRLGPWLVPPPVTPVLAAGLCAMQPDAVGLAHAGFDAQGAGPILILATTGDPTTPISAARRALDDLADAALLKVEADHHTLYGYALVDPTRPFSRCVVEQVERVLIELEIAVAADLLSMTAGLPRRSRASRPSGRSHPDTGRPTGAVRWLRVPHVYRQGGAWSPNLGEPRNTSRDG